MYSINYMSEKFDLPLSTIRYYEEIGLLENVVHQGNRRVFSDEHIDRLNAIECFKKARLSLDDIKKFFEYEKDMASNSSKILEMMESQEKETQAELEKLKAGLEHLQKKVKYYSCVNEAVLEGREIPKWNDIIAE